MFVAVGVFLSVFFDVWHGASTGSRPQIGFDACSGSIPPARFLESAHVGLAGIVHRDIKLAARLQCDIKSQLAATVILMDEILHHLAPVIYVGELDHSRVC